MTVDLARIIKAITEDILKGAREIMSSSVGVNEKVGKNTLVDSNLYNQISTQFIQNPDEIVINLFFNYYMEFIESGRMPKKGKRPPVLEIAKWLGAIASAGVLRRVTDGATVRSLKAALHGVYPEVFGYTAYFKNMEKLGGTVADLARGTDGSGKLGAEFVVAVGHGLLDDALSRLPTPLLKRFRLKLPKDLPPRPSDHLTTQSLNLQLLMKLRFPEAYALCSS